MLIHRKSNYDVTITKAVDDLSQQRRDLENLVHRLSREAREAGESTGTWISAETAAISPMLPASFNNVTWSDAYLCGVRDLPRELRAVLLALSISNLPYQLCDALSQHAVVMGKESPAFTYAQSLWMNYHEKLWSNYNRYHGDRRREELEYLHPDSSCEENSRREGNLYVENAFLGALMPHSMEMAEREVLGEFSSVFMPRRIHSRGAWIALGREHRVLKHGEFSASWDDVLLDVELQADLDRGRLTSSFAIDVVESLLAQGSFDGGSEYMSGSHMEGLRAIYSALVKEDEAARAALNPSTIFPLAEVVMGLQEHFTGELVGELGALVEEYNREWALASFDWSSRDGDESSVAKALELSVAQSPWSNEMDDEKKGSQA